MIEKQVLSNGVRILTEEMPHLRTASLGVWVDSGSRHERPGQEGMAHFIEHMVFKGSERHSARELARAFDVLGGQANAFTSKEFTCFYNKTLDCYVVDCLELLADMLLHPKLAPQDMENERRVILEELAMYEDSPEDLAADQLFEAVWRDSSLGPNILGNPESLEQATPEGLRAFMQENYTPEHLVVSVCGNFQKERVLPAIERLFQDHGGRRTPRTAEQTVYLPSIVTAEKDFEQSHLCLGFPGLSYGDSDSYTLTAVNNILGNGMSSRLFQRLREELGLVYSVYSFLTPHRETGLLGFYAAFNHGAWEQVCEELLRELQEIRDKGITPEELELSKQLMRINLVMGMESSYARMSHMAKGELLHGYILTQEEMEGRIEAVTLEKANELLRRLLDFPRMSISAVGKPLGEKYYQSLRSFA